MGRTGVVGATGATGETGATGFTVQEFHTSKRRVVREIPRGCPGSVKDYHYCRIVCDRCAFPCPLQLQNARQWTVDGR